MLKRFVVLCLVCATVLCCTACGKKPYDIIEVDGKHYMSFNTYLLGESAISDIGRYAGVSLQFTSIAQMKKKFQNGAFVSVRIYDPIERPSVEWLSSFGLTPYEG